MDKKKIETLKSKSNLSSFSHYILLDSSSLFPSLWKATQDLILSFSLYDLIQEIFIKSIYLLSPDQVKSIEKNHSGLIKYFFSLFLTPNSSKIQAKILSSEMGSLLTDIQNFLTPDKGSKTKAFQGFFQYLRVEIIEKREGLADLVWDCKEAIFKIYLIELGEKVYFLYHKDKIEQEKIENGQANEDDSPLEVSKDDCLGVSDDSVLEDIDSDDDENWKEKQEILNNGKAPLIKGYFKGEGPVLDFSCINVNDKQKFKYSVSLGNEHPVTKLAFTLIEALAKQGNFTAAFQVFTNTVYYFPLSHSKAFEQKYLKLHKRFGKAVESQDLKLVLDLISSEEAVLLFHEIEGLTEKSESSFIFPIFPLVRTWKIGIVEKSGNSEYVWNVKKPLMTVVLLLFDRQVYILIPGASFYVKQNKAEGWIEKLDDRETVGPDQDDINLSVDSSDKLEICQNEEFLAGKAPARPKNVKFKSDLTIDLEDIRRDSSPSVSPTYLRSVLRKESILSPVQRADSPVFKYIEKSKKFNNPIDRYVALSKAKN